MIGILGRPYCPEWKTEVVSSMYTTPCEYSTLIQGLGVSLFIFSLASHTAGVLTVTTHRNSTTISGGIIVKALQSSGIALIWHARKT